MAYVDTESRIFILIMPDMDIMQEVNEVYQRAKANSFKVNAILIPAQMAYEFYKSYMNSDVLYLRVDGSLIINNCKVIYAAVEKVEIAYVLQ